MVITIEVAAAVALVVLAIVVHLQELVVMVQHLQ